MLGAAAVTGGRAFLDGVGRVHGAPGLLAGLLALTLMVALPLSLAFGSMPRARLGATAAGRITSATAAPLWWQALGAHASGPGKTLTPSIIGFASILDGIRDRPNPRGIAPALAATSGWLLLTSFLTGGLIDRYARQRPARAHGFFLAGARHFWPNARLGVLALAGYCLLFAAVRGWGVAVPGLQAETTLTGGQTTVVIDVAAFMLIAIALALLGLLLDYARIRLVVEQRRSAIGALAGAWRFISRHARHVLTLWLLNAAVYLALMAVAASLSSAAPPTDIRRYLATALGLAYLFGCYYLQLVVYGAETALFQCASAHATYTAMPEVVWPDSPAAESVSSAAPTPLH